MVRPISPETLAQVTRDEGMLAAIQLRQDERNARLLAMGKQARRLNLESKGDKQ